MQRKERRGTDVIVCFIDYQKVFNNVKPDILLNTLLEIGIEASKIRVMA